MQRIKTFLLKSYHTDSVAFYHELVSLITSMIAATIIAATAKDPMMDVAYPLFIIGAITGSYAYWRRELVWPLVLTTFYLGVNIIGLIVLYS